MTDAREPAPDWPRSQSVIVAGASAGGVEALIALVRSLPKDFPHAILIVLHVSPTGTSVLPAILNRACHLPVSSPQDGEELCSGHVYVAPPDLHLIIGDGRLHLSQAPRENGHRPAIDPTMRSAAEAYGGGTIGIVLSGSRDDGTAGLLAIKASGGKAIVQDPAEALYDAMPRNAMAHVELDAVLPIAGMADWIMRHAGNNGAEGGHAPVEAEETSNPSPATPAGEGTRFTCPDCGGVLFERHEGALARFECSVGHVFSIESLSSAQAEALENALWAAVRSLEDRAALLRRLGAWAGSGGQERSAASFGRQADEAIERARTIREAIERSHHDAVPILDS